MKMSELLGFEYTPCADMSQLVRLAKAFIAWIGKVEAKTDTLSSRIELLEKRVAELEKGSTDGEKGVHED